MSRIINLFSSLSLVLSFVRSCWLGLPLLPALSHHLTESSRLHLGFPSLSFWKCSWGMKLGQLLGSPCFPSFRGQYPSLPDVQYLENHCLILFVWVLVVSDGRVNLVLLLHLDQKLKFLVVSSWIFFSYWSGFLSFCARCIFTHCFCLFVSVSLKLWFTNPSSCLSVCIFLASVFADSLQMSYFCVKCPDWTTWTLLNRFCDAKQD